MDKTVLLERIYHGKSTGAFRGPKALFKQTQRLGHTNITLSDCYEYLSTLPSYSLYRPARRNYHRNAIIALFCGQVVQIDIMDMQWVRAENDGYLYALLAYDTYSKYLTSFPMKNRKPESVLDGLEDLVANLPFSILNIYWDKEGSFLSRKVQSWLKEHDILNYTTTSQVKAPGVERVIRTIRLACSRFFESTSTQRWIDFLPEFVSNYNNRDHSTTKLKPLDLANDPLLVVAQPYVKSKTRKLPPIGSLVRLNKIRGVFGKESRGSWTKEVFRVVRHKLNATVPMVVVEDLLGEPIRGALYPEECQTVEWDGEKQVERVIGTRTRGGINEYHVTYTGWPTKFNEWTTKNPLE